MAHPRGAALRCDRLSSEMVSQKELSTRLLSTVTCRHSKGNETRGASWLSVDVGLGELPCFPVCQQNGVAHWLPKPFWNNMRYKQTCMFPPDSSSFLLREPGKRAWALRCFLMFFTTLSDQGQAFAGWQICWIAQRTVSENYCHWVPPQTCSKNEAQTRFNKVSKEL